MSGPTTINIPGQPPIIIPGPGPITIPPLPPLPPIPEPTPPPTTGQTPPAPGAAYIGTVTGGSGNTYQMNCKGLGNIEATVPQIDPGETVPIGTVGVVVSVYKRDQTGAVVGGDYYFQPPVWLQVVLIGLFSFVARFC